MKLRASRTRLLLLSLPMMCVCSGDVVHRKSLDNIKRPCSASPMLPLGIQAVNVIQCNDDGWAEINIRELYWSLTNAGFRSFICAPATNESGRGSLDEPPTEVGGKGCEFDSCPPNSPSTGRNASMPRFNYVNSFPVTAMKFGIQNLSGTFGGRPDLAVSGFNVGSNLALTTLISGTVGAAVEAVKQGIPNIAFSGRTGAQTAWNAIPESYVKIYADLATTVAQMLTGFWQTIFAARRVAQRQLPLRNGQ